VRRSSVVALAAVVCIVACTNPVTPGGEHLEAVEVVLTEADGRPIAQTADNASWQGGPIVLDAGAVRPLRVLFTDVYGAAFTLEGRRDHTLRVEIEAQRVATWTTSDGHGTLHAAQPGITRLRVHIWHLTHADFTSPWLTVRTVASALGLSP